jgi:2-keto-4-pentenoate hydratase/2-oxohepta-3-ene-1,7-dioic acid hydratase in catechol pathway
VLAVKLVLFQERSVAGNAPVRAGILLEERVIDVTSLVKTDSAPGDRLMETIIDNFPKLLPNFERAAARNPGLALAQVQLAAPVRPRKILCCIGNYWEHAQREARPLGMYLKNPDAVIGPDDTVVLPNFQASVFHHEAELSVVMRGPAKDVSERDFQSAVFGYCVPQKLHDGHAACASKLYS